MRTVVHISDVHFGRVDYLQVKPLIAAVHKVNPDVVVVSGDLTQRARSHQYIEAKEFLEELPLPQIVIPGNHDIPLWNPIMRFINPLEKFKKFITHDLFPFYADDEVAVIGVNTARSFTTKYGRINRTQIQEIRNKLGPLPDDVVKIVVTHHPFEVPEGYKNLRQIVGRSQTAMKALAECGADLFLAGHLHQAFTGRTAERYKIDNYSALIVQAGTAISTRGRSGPNSFNVIRCEHPVITVERYDWHDEAQHFDKAECISFRHTDIGWSKIEEPESVRPHPENPPLRGPEHL